MDRITPVTKPDRKMKEVGPNECRILRADLESHLFMLEEKFGLKIDIGKMTYSGTSVRMSIEAALVAENGLTLNRKAKDFEQLASLYGFEPDDLGKTFKSGGKEYRITGLNSRAGKMPVLAECLADGRGYKFAEAGVLRALGRAAPAAVHFRR